MGDLVSWIDSPIEKILILMLSSVAFYFIIDFKKNIQRILNRHSDKIDQNSKNLNSELVSFRHSLAQHSSDIDLSQKKISGDFFLLKESAFKMKEEIKDDMVKTQLEFKELKMELIVICEKMKINTSKSIEVSEKINNAKEEIDKNINSINLIKFDFDKSNLEVNSISKKVNENRDALLKSKEVLKMCTQEIKLLKKKAHKQ